jgi:hypothetical protein
MPTTTTTTITGLNQYVRRIRVISDTSFATAREQIPRASGLLGEGEFLPPN